MLVDQERREEEVEALLERSPSVGVATVLSGSSDRSIRVCSLVVRCDGSVGSGGGSGASADLGSGSGSGSSGGGGGSGGGSRLREAREAMRRSMQRQRRTKGSTVDSEDGGDDGQEDGDERHDDNDDARARDRGNDDFEANAANMDASSAKPDTTTSTASPLLHRRMVLRRAAGARLVLHLNQPASVFGRSGGIGHVQGTGSSTSGSGLGLGLARTALSLTRRRTAGAGISTDDEPSPSPSPSMHATAPAAAPASHSSTSSPNPALPPAHASAVTCCLLVGFDESFALPSQSDLDQVAERVAGGGRSSSSLSSPILSLSSLSSPVRPIFASWSFQ